MCSLDGRQRQGRAQISHTEVLCRCSLGDEVGCISQQDKIRYCRVPIPSTLTCL